MGNKLIIGGAEDFANTAREITDKAAPLTKAGADDARKRVRSAYPRVTGRLQDGVVVERRASPAGVTVYDVSSTAPYASFYEFGTHHQRARPTFVPITNRERRDTTKAVVDVVKAAGLTVTGDE